MLLRLLFLGSPQIQREGTAVHIETRKAVALLAYLAVTGEMHSRDSIATLLWPQFDQQRARTSLRNTLSLLKRAIGSDWVWADRHTVGLNWEADIDVDVRQFRHLQATTDAPVDESALETTIALYRDDFLAGFSLPDSAVFDEWQFFEAEHLRQEMAHALAAGINWIAAKGKWAQAIPYARRWVHLDPLHEPAHYCLMKLYAQTGQRAAALRQFDLCRQTLAEQLGVPPGNEMAVLRQQVQQQPATIHQEPFLALKMETPAPEFPVHHAPVYANSFVGRQTELAQLVDNLANARYPLITITGAGGIGKTRLAVQAARQPAIAFTDGIYYIDLAPLRSVHQLLPTIIASLSLPMRGAATPQEQLVNYLQHKKVLLVLDNFEHLMDGVDVILQLLQSAPEAHLLITSREILNLRQEWVYPLRGLPVPDSDTTTPAAMFSSVQLFVQRACQLRPDFALTAEEKDVVKICQLVEGMPLGIELAAAWVRLLPCDQIAREIESNIDFLTSARRDTDDRHRSLRAVFAHSWALLTPIEQQTFAQLSLFRGGATLAALQAVTQAPLFTLYGLVNKSLLRLEENGRYTLHELLRQFAAEKVALDTTLHQDTLVRYCAYYTDFIKAQEPYLAETAHQAQSAAAITQDIENVRQAWQWAADNQQAEAIAQALQGLYLYYGIHSHYKEAQVLFQYAIDAFLQQEDRPAYPSIVMQLLTRKGETAHILGDLAEAKRILHRSLQYAEPLNATHEMAICYRLIGLTAYRQGEYSEAQTYLSKAVALTDAQTKPLYYNILILSLSAVQVASGNYSQAQQHLRQCLASYQRHDYQWGIAHTLRFLGKVAYLTQDPDQARRYYEESLLVCQTIGHEAGEALVLSELSLIDLAQEQHEAAHQALQRALTLSLTSQTESVQAETLKNLALLMLAWQEPKRAGEYLREALQTAVAAQSPPLILEILLQMTRLDHLSPDKTNIVYNLVQQHPAANQATRQMLMQLQEAALQKVEPVTLSRNEKTRLLAELVEICLT